MSCESWLHKISSDTKVYAAGKSMYRISLGVWFDLGHACSDLVEESDQAVALAEGKWARTRCRVLSACGHAFLTTGVNAIALWWLGRDKTTVHNRATHVLLVIRSHFTQSPKEFGASDLEKYVLWRSLFGEKRIGKVKRKPSMRDTASNADTDLCSDNGERLYDLNLPALVKFSYAAEREDELSLVKGARVVVMEKCSDGWWRGVCEGRSGWFPSNYVTEDGDGLTGDPAGSLTEKLAAAVHSANGGGGVGGRALHTVQALYPFNSGNDEELSFEKGEVMDVVEKPENDPEWWKCRKADGQLGLVPKNYVTVLQNSHSVLGNAGPPTPDCDYIEPSGTGRFAGRQWYYGKVTRHQAEVALNHRGEEGDFLIRDSESSVSLFQVTSPLHKHSFDHRPQFRPDGKEFLTYLPQKANTNPPRPSSQPAASSTPSPSKHQTCNRSPNDFSISLKAQGKNKHFKVQLKDSLYCIGQRKFNSMEELVDHYKKAPIFTSEQGDKLVPEAEPRFHIPQGVRTCSIVLQRTITVNQHCSADVVIDISGRTVPCSVPAPKQADVIRLTGLGAANLPRRGKQGWRLTGLGHIHHHPPLPNDPRPGAYF
ncbi:hypothetical protein JZ751_013690 [Albula glossodonta]|uniref:Uncharacterized protein n=1 Tax=Albula glossodonta TaxID=121402 RepID=A0A8T2NTN8_9TELE|nr:hypothetical protein JZ751_013690 [Albula glossodonta]